MIDIAALHRKSGSTKILGKFFATSGYKATANYLSMTGLPEEEIVQRRQAHRGAVGIAKVHPMLVIEYLRWVDFDTYANWVRKHVEEAKSEQGG
jgi:hypothetical protein